MADINSHFLIQCKKCGSNNVETAHGEDFAYTEITLIYCKDCGNEVEI